MCFNHITKWRVTKGKVTKRWNFVKLTLVLSWHFETSCIFILSKVPIVALTATATPAVRKDICLSLKLKNARYVCTGFDRWAFVNLHVLLLYNKESWHFYFKSKLCIYAEYLTNCVVKWCLGCHRDWFSQARWVLEVVVLPWLAIPITLPWAPW